MEDSNKYSKQWFRYEEYETGETDDMKEITDYKAAYEKLREQWDKLEETANQMAKTIREQQDSNRDLQAEINDLRLEMSRLEHEDEVVITTKHKIRNIDLYFEEGGK